MSKLIKQENSVPLRNTEVSYQNKWLQENVSEYYRGNGKKWTGEVYFSL